MRYISLKDPFASYRDHTATLCALSLTADKEIEINTDTRDRRGEDLVGPLTADRLLTVMPRQGKARQQQQNLCEAERKKNRPLTGVTGEGSKVHGWRQPCMTQRSCMLSHNPAYPTEEDSGYERKRPGGFLHGSTHLELGRREDMTHEWTNRLRRILRTNKRPAPTTPAATKWRGEGRTATFLSSLRMRSCGCERCESDQQ
jgi:hypothetical protein